MISFIFSILEYAAIAGVGILWKVFEAGAMKIAVAMALTMLFSFIAKACSHSGKSLEWIIFLECIALGVLALQFPAVKSRLIIMLFSACVAAVGGHEIENGASDNNEGSYTALAACALLIQDLVALYFCFKPSGGVRKYDIIYFVILCTICSDMLNQVGGVQEFDKREREERRDREIRINRYKNSAFAKATNNSYSDVMNDKGLYGEYCSSTWLSDISDAGHPYRALFSVYVPLKNSEIGSTELDSVVITQTGIDVLEVKNRAVEWKIDGNMDISGIIHRNGERETVKNPLKQNQNHIKALRRFILDSNNRKVKEAFATLDSSVRGYLVFGPETISSCIINTSQGYCGFNKIGKKISEYIDKNGSYDNDEMRKREEAIEVLYEFLKGYQNKEDLKRRHDEYVKNRYGDAS
jgi:hypothetical protein